MRLGPNPPDTSKEKWFHSRKKELESPLEVEEPGSVSMMPDYVPPRLADAPKIRISKNARYRMEEPNVSKGDRIMVNNGKILRIHPQCYNKLGIYLVMLVNFCFHQKKNWTTKGLDSVDEIN